MKGQNSLSSLLFGLFVLISAVPAFAVSINGSISVSDGFNLSSLGQTTSIVSQLNNIDVLNGGGITLASGCTGAFGTCTSLLITNGGASDFTIGTAPVLVYEYDGFKFTLTSFDSVNRGSFECSVFSCGDSLGIIGSGIVNGNGLDNSLFLMVWTGQGSCNSNDAGTACAGDVTASWSASISARGIQLAPAATTPEPAAMLLLALGLIGVGATIRKHR
jgi:PEP-CTERM motif-containing protein